MTRLLLPCCVVLLSVCWLIFSRVAHWPTLARVIGPRVKAAPKHAERLSAGVTEVERAGSALPTRSQAQSGVHQLLCRCWCALPRHARRVPARVGAWHALRPCCAFRAGCGVSSIASGPIARVFRDAGWNYLSTLGHGHNTCDGKRKCISATRLRSRRCDDWPHAGNLHAYLTYCAAHVSHRANPRGSCMFSDACPVSGCTFYGRAHSSRARATLPSKLAGSGGPTAAHGTNLERDSARLGRPALPRHLERCSKLL